MADEESACKFAHPAAVSAVVNDEDPGKATTIITAAVKLRRGVPRKPIIMEILQGKGSRGRGVSGESSRYFFVHSVVYEVILFRKSLL